MHKDCKGEEFVCLFVFCFVFYFTSQTYSQELLGIRGGGVPPASPNNKIKIVISHTRSVLRPVVIITQIRTPTKIFLKSISNLLSFQFSSAGNETTTTFINSRTSLENQTRFQTKMGTVCTRFETAQKSYPSGRYIPGRITQGSTLPHLPQGKTSSSDE